MNEDRRLVSFEWAVRQLLRNSTHFELVEGFLSELLGRDVKIANVLERDPGDMFYRTGVVAEDEFQKVIFIEMHFTSDPIYIQRMLLGASKIITGRMPEVTVNGRIDKIYSINILYYDLGFEKDYVYHGKMYFRGIHEQDKLELSMDQRMTSKGIEPGDLYPEYYLLKLEKFNDHIVNKLDEWIYFLKNTRIEESFSARGLLKARETLDYDQLSKEEKAEYDCIAEARTRHQGQINYARRKGKMKREAKAKAEIVVNGKRTGLSIEQIQAITGLDEEKILEILSSDSEK
jgi:predicted transposase/invertase (TIGR01784 family)